MQWVAAPRRNGQTGFGPALEILLHRIDVVADATAALRPIEAAKGLCIVAFVNANTVAVCARHRHGLQAVCAADHVFRDGVGMAAAARLRGHRLGLNMNGTDLIPRFLRDRRQGRVALYGTREPWLSNAARAVSSLGHDVVDVWHGFESDFSIYAERVLRARPDVVILAMGQPKQELVAETLRARLPADVPCVVFCGGAILDFLGERFPRAPQWLRRARLEWLFRLSQEPRRLLRRYTIETGAVLLHAILTRAERERGGRRAGGSRTPLA